MIRVGYDNDGPLTEEATGMFFEFCRSKGIECDYGLFVETGSWDLGMPGYTHQQRNELYLECRRSSFPSDRPTAGAVEVVESLVGDVQEQYVITTRNRETEPETRRFLEQHYPSFRRNCCYCFGIAPKATHVLGLDLAYYVENNVNEANQAAGVGCSGVILFPVRGVRRKNIHHKVITLVAEKFCCPEMTDTDWMITCVTAWAEIGEIIRGRI